MDRLDAMRVFVLVAEEQSFAAAGRRIGLSPPVVTRAVAALEDRLGARLLTRTTRSVRLTEAGARFHADCRRILAEVDEAEASALGAHAEPQGRLAITAPAMFGRTYIAPLLIDFLNRHRGISVQSLFIDRVVDLLEEGQDVAIRIGSLPDSSLSVTRCGSVRHMLCAAPTYLARAGSPERLPDLEEMDTIEFASGPPPGRWTFTVEGRTQQVRLNARLITNAAEAAIAASIAGCGIVRVLSYQVAEHLRAGRLEVVLPQFEPPPSPVQIVHAEGRRASAKLRTFVDFAAARLRTAPELNEPQPDAGGGFGPCGVGVGRIGAAGPG
ncbi:LysR family transcriptional regulator [Brevundimonas diminuta]|uniref:LysR family transcriptional regulator n=1 Tax=Brevundimonas diminuta TaxID=293 RepID=UPI00320B8722